MLNSFARFLAYFIYFKLKIKSKFFKSNSNKLLLGPVADSIVESLSNDEELASFNIKELIEENQKLTKLLNKRKTSIIGNLKYIKFFFRLKKLTTKIIEKDKIVIKTENKYIAVPNEQYYNIKMYRNKKGKLVATYKNIYNKPVTIWSDNGFNWINPQTGDTNCFYYSEQHLITELIHMADNL